MNTLEYFFGVLVFTPLTPLPHIFFTRLMPLGCRPSPPPSGWSTGFIALPLTVGLIPSYLDRPAFPKFLNLYSSLDTWPTLAQDSKGTFLISVEGILSKAYPPS